MTKKEFPIFTGKQRGDWIELNTDICDPDKYTVRGRSPIQAITKFETIDFPGSIMYVIEIDKNRPDIAKLVYETSQKRAKEGCTGCINAYQWDNPKAVNVGSLSNYAGSGKLTFDPDKSTIVATDNLSLEVERELPRRSKFGRAPKEQVYMQGLEYILRELAKTEDPQTHQPVFPAGEIAGALGRKPAAARPSKGRAR